MSTHRNFTTDFVPRRFADLCGNAELVAVISRWIIEKRIPPFLLFSGPIGVGKTVLADLLTRAAICGGRRPNEYEACGLCEPCRCPGGAHYHGIGSRIDPDGFQTALRYKGSLHAHDTSSWFPIWIDEIHELHKQAQRDLRQEMEEKWERCFLVGTTSSPDKLDQALRDRFSEHIILPPRKSEQVTWLREVICSQAGIRVVDPKSLGIVVDYSRGHFRKALKILQRIQDLALAVDEKNVRRAIESCGYAGL